ncbi:helix-turn-helix transcriptional regulator [Xanthomonas sp. A2111]|uniref:Helix-turn-helix transcriptional regulator n=1 Tax=Xanthomonas hawaiiensis TaxID=3003247 RepID=A0ABU2I055_9XANT|nr:MULTISPECIES: helix-turn-helix transcriptional regulator [unclassified Xanthomonas]MBO9827962.1 helix-turn-helix transcriptional regulator [Xanthomonas sp. A2111]MBO9875671.1 helix-turn-helix transcriptional regulator [Xanthomonas sp. D-93]MDS9991524.1 helix-turn-helix transcriptional regulator [Xanthomonas sp. A2111]WNH43348.1 helix-turn-helix transcriptional regulator [Xanthomonas sp. A6251]
MTTHAITVGDVLRDWRARRRLSQLDLACAAEVSTRHLSFVESGRAVPSRELLLRLAEPLAMPLRERNRLLHAAGYAPVHGERALDAPDMAAALAAVDAVLRAHAPFPALALDRHWNLVRANDAAGAMLVGIDPALLAAPVNVLRATLHPNGLAPRIANLAEWRHHLLARLRLEIDQSADPELERLHAELDGFPCPASDRPHCAAARVAVPLSIRNGASGGILSFLSTTTVFGTATDVTLAELTLECFYPADDATRQALLAGSLA